MKWVGFAWNCFGMLQIHLPVTAAPKSFCNVYPKMHGASLELFNITTTVVLATNNRGLSIESLMAQLAYTAITLAETGFDFTSLNGCWFTERVRNAYTTTGENWASIDQETVERNGFIETFCRLPFVCMCARACVRARTSTVFTEAESTSACYNENKEGQAKWKHQTLR
jgi:hypothetical protein